MSVYLRKTSESTYYKEDIKKYKEETLAYERSVSGAQNLTHFDDLDEWFKYVKDNESKETVHDKLVTGTNYILVRETDNKVIGFLDIRHELNDYLNNFGGHIGYSIRPTERKKGYATKMLELGLIEARKLGIKDVLVTCNKDNIGSRKVILNNGGVYINELAESNGNIVQRYIIKC